MPSRIQWALPFAALALSACVYTPRSVTAYDEHCRIKVRQMQLDAQQMGSIGQCENEGCVGNVIMAGVTSAGTAIVSGTIVLASNMAYWVEKQANCNPVQQWPDEQGADEVEPEKTD